MAKFQEIESAVVSLDKQVKILTNDLSKLITTVNSQSKSQSDLAAKTKAVENATTQITETERQRLKLLAQLKQANSDSIQKNVELQVQLQNQRKTNKDLAREKLNLIGAYEKESKRLNDLRKRYKDLAAGGKENTKRSKELRKEITALDGKLKGIDKTVGQSQRNVGNYGDALSSLPGTFGIVASSAQRLSKILLATPLGWLIGLIAGAGAALKSFFVSSEEGQNRWNTIMTKSKVVLNNFRDGVANVGKSIVEFTDNIKNNEEGIKGWAKTVGENARKKWNDFKNDVEDQGFWETVKGRATDTYDTIIGKIQEVREENKKEIQQAEDLANRQNALNKQERDAIIEVAKLRRDVAEFRASAADKENTTAQERIDFLNKALESENEILRVNESIAAEKLRLKQIENSLSNSTREDLMAEAQLEKELIDLQTTNAERRRRFTAEQQTFIRELEAEKIAAANREQALIDKNIDADIALNEQELNNLAKQLDDEYKLQLEADKRYLDEVDKRNAEEEAKELEKQERIKEIKFAGIDAASKIVSDRVLTGLDDDLAAFQAAQDAEQAILDAKLQNKEISEEDFRKESKKLEDKSRIESAKAEKKKAGYSNAIDTITAVAKTFAELGWPAGIIPAGVMAGIGLANGIAIASEPIPKFEHGTNGQLRIATDAIVGEAGTELVTTDKGSFFTPPTATKVHLPANSQVFPNYSAETQAALSGGMTQKMYEGLINEQRLTRKALTNQPKQITNLTDKGLERAYIKKQTRINLRDEWLR